MSGKKAVTTLDCVLSKDSNRVFVAGLGQEINFRACLRVLPRPRHIAKCWLTSTNMEVSIVEYCGGGATIQVWAWIAASMNWVATHWTTDFESAHRQEFLYSPLTQTRFRAHSVPDSMKILLSSPVKRPQSRTDCSTSSSAADKNGWSLRNYFEVPFIKIRWTEY